jgi:hypothetical protein
MKTKGAKTILLLTAFAFFALAPFRANFLLIPISATQLSPQVSFDRDIRPIFVERCLKCHGEKTQFGGLRLDVKSFAMRGGQNGPVIVPGKALESRLYQRVVAGNDERMPPTGERLSAAQVALLRSWIDAGASWPEGDGATGRRSDATTDQSRHWAWQPIKRPAVPSLATNIRNPIDAFISARLAQAGLAMSPAADRRTLIRRLSARAGRAGHVAGSGSPYIDPSIVLRSARLATDAGAHAAVCE